MTAKHCSTEQIKAQNLVQFHVDFMEKPIKTVSTHASTVLHNLARDHKKYQNLTKAVGRTSFQRDRSFKEQRKAFAYAVK